ncbi:MAG: aminoacyl-histidine dipeptidase [Candidatus Cloacimonadota bacterium]|nr:MAG: aminoacyl-histidine dipeptidase [Candidatus Cloacimonadota bacterium]
MDNKTKKILDIFEEINKIPRKSKHEEKISKWLCDWAEKNNFEYKTDEVLNVFIKVPASQGYEKSPIIVLQGHMDMVCEKTPESPHDFSKDAIKHIFEGDWLHADQTTLGADNGIALATAMAIALDEAVKHPELELVFTIDEETGLTGANTLDASYINGKILLNIDSEDEGVFTVGCAGGRDTHIRLPTEKSELEEDETVYLLKVGGLLGGHSGVDIKKQRANANKLLARVLNEISFGSRIIEIAGGTAHNAISRDAQALIAVKEKLKVKEKIEEFGKIFRNEFKPAEKKVYVYLEASDKKISEAFTEETTEKVINLLLALPHGIIAFSAELEGLVETSCNAATVITHEDYVEIKTSQRSSVMSRLDAITFKIEATAKLAGAKVESGNGYPAWQPDTESPLLAKCVKTYEELFDKKPVVEIIHAGLECGVIGSKIEGMDMISLGPTIKNPHSPDECLFVPSVKKIWDFLVRLLESYK